MKGRLDLPKDNALFTYVHRMNNDYETRVIKRTFKGGGMIVPSAMRVYKTYLSASRLLSLLRDLCIMESSSPAIHLSRI
jgi:hypothetical protein